MPIPTALPGVTTYTIINITSTKATKVTLRH